jgi:hypothetical protein
MLMMVCKKSVKNTARFIFTAARAGNKVLLTTAFSDRAVHATYEKTTLIPATSAVHIFRLQTILPKEFGVKT